MTHRHTDIALIPLFFTEKQAMQLNIILIFRIILGSINKEKMFLKKQQNKDNSKLTTRHLPSII